MKSADEFALEAATSPDTELLTLDSVREPERFGGHPVRVAVFEGPLDLLLYLVRAHRCDICDVPMREVCDQFVEYLALMDEVGLDYAGDFLLTAATLLQIKARMLLPPKQSQNEDVLDAADADPRAQLVRQLLEYQQFQSAAEELSQRRDDRAQLFARTTPEVSPSENEPLRLDGVSTFDLLRALRRVMERQATRPVATIRRREPFSLPERLRELLMRLRDGAQTFGALCDDCESRLEIVITFLAVLELVRRGRAQAQQLSLFDEIEIALL